MSDIQYPRMEGKKYCTKIGKIKNKIKKAEYCKGGHYVSTPIHSAIAISQS